MISTADWPGELFDLRKAIRLMSEGAISPKSCEDPARSPAKMLRNPAQSQGYLFLLNALQQEGLLRMKPQASEA